MLSLKNPGEWLHKHIVVGIDPGATIGVAILSLSGEKLATGSFSGGGISEAIRFIERHGTPSLVACDVSPPPDFALRLASYFSCRLHSPAHNIREEDKRLIARGAGVENNHERDAYTAAVFAYRAHANKLRQIDSLDTVVRRSERLVDRSNDAPFDRVDDFSQEDRDKVKHLLLKGYKVKDAFLELGEPAPAEPSAPSQKQGMLQRSLSSDELRARASSLARENAHLRMLTSRLESEKQQLENRVRLLENGVRQSVLRDSELRKLRFQLGMAIEKLGWRGKKHAKNPPTQHASANQPSARKQDTPKSAPSHQKQPEQPPKTQNTARQKPKSTPVAPSDEGGLYNLGKPDLNLDKLVAEYRKGRK